MKVFVQDPEVFLNDLGISLACAVNPDHSATIDEAHRSAVNWEVFFFASADAKAAFDADPLKYCGLVTDAVSKVRFRPGGDSPNTTFEDRVYYFETATNLEEFERVPGSRANPAMEMIPESGPAADTPR